MAGKESPSKRMQKTWSLTLFFILFLCFPITYFLIHALEYQGSILFSDFSIPFLSVLWGTCFLIQVTIESVTDNFNLSKEILTSTTISFFASLFGNIASFLLASFIFGFQNHLILNIVSFAFCFFLVALIRYTLHISLSRKKRKIILVGPQDEVKSLAKKFLINPKASRKIKYLFFMNNGLEMPSDIFTFISQCDEVFLTPGLSSRFKDQIILSCIAKHKIEVFVVPTTYEIGIYSANESNADDILTFHARDLRLSLWQRFIKRSFDILGSFLLLLVGFPLMIVVSLVIKLQDGGPVIYKQERITENNRPFTLLKFRSMAVDAEKGTGAVLATKADPRITKFGRFTRKSRIDELPQFWNVFIGQMSFVGPRPERPEFVEEFLKETPEYQYRSNVKAGMTGLAQTKGRYDTKYQDKLRWDLLYIRNYSLLIDIKIILRTLWTIFDKASAQGVDSSSKLEDMLLANGLEVNKTASYWEIKAK